MMINLPQQRGLFLHRGILTLKRQWGAIEDLDVLSGASDELTVHELGDELLGEGVLNRVVVLGLAGGDDYEEKKHERWIGFREREIGRGTHC